MVSTLHKIYYHGFRQNRKGSRTKVSGPLGNVESCPSPLDGPAEKRGGARGCHGSV